MFSFWWQTLRMISFRLLFSSVKQDWGEKLETPKAWKMHTAAGCVFLCALVLECACFECMAPTLPPTCRSRFGGQRSFSLCTLWGRETPWRRRWDAGGIQSYLALHIQSFTAWWINDQGEGQTCFSISVLLRLSHTRTHTESHTDGWVNRADCNLSLCDCVQLKHGLTLPCKLLIHLPCLFCASTLLAVKLNFLFSDQVYLRGASLFFCVHRYEGGKHTLQEKSWSHTVPLGEIIHTSWTFSTFCHIMNTNWIVRKMTHGG